MKTLILIFSLLISLCVRGAQFPAFIQATSQIPANIIGWYKLNNNANDSSGNGNTGTLVGSPSFATGENGLVNGAINLNGSSQYVSLPIGAQTVFTITAWVKPSTSGGSEMDAFDRSHDGGTFAQNWILGSDGSSNTHWRIQCMDSGDVTLFAVSANTISTSSWTFLAATINSDGSEATLTLYENGTQVATQSGSIGALGTAPQTANIGCYDQAANFFPGLIDDVRIYNAVLSSGAISSLFSANAAFYLPEQKTILVFDWDSLNYKPEL